MTTAVAGTLDHETADDAVALDAYSPAVSSVRVGGGGPGPGGSGSAVVVSPDGLLVTSAHVVRHAQGGKAAFSSGAEWEFDVAGADPLSDLAVLRLRMSAQETSPPAATLGDA